MTKKWTFPFHYGGEAESYTFYRVPKILFTEEVFDHLSTDAKLLYGLLLDRMQLSLKNGWVDEEGKVFIYYTVESIMDALTCGNKKAGQLLAELDEKKGIGLISRVRQGLGKPDRIYVHKCVVPEMSFAHVQKCRNDTQIRLIRIIMNIVRLILSLRRSRDGMRVRWRNADPTGSIFRRAVPLRR